MQDSTERPALAIIGGRDAYKLLSRRHDAQRLDRIDTPFGASQPIYIFRHDGAPYYFLSRHGETGYTISPSFVNYRANIYALKELDVKHIVSWGGSAAINLKYLVGQHVIVNDLVDETKNRESTFFRFRGLGLIRQSEVFCPMLRAVLRGALLDLHLDFADQGTYVCVEGPRLETAAEVRKYAAYGGDLVGMTLAPEAFLAKELEMCYAAACYVVNYAEGVRERPVVSERLLGGLIPRSEKRRVEEAFGYLPKVLARIMGHLAKAKVVCTCQEAMLYYKKQGRISDNWREWLNP
ncbi:MAG: MTAP family purine nucleoside phosphorylase [Planctomycetota bacterium]